MNPPVVAECEGDYTFDKRSGSLQWQVGRRISRSYITGGSKSFLFQLPVIDASNKTGSMEFACGGNADDFFPVRVSFYSKKSYSEIQVFPHPSSHPLWDFSEE